MMNSIALVVVSVFVGMCHPNFHCILEWGNGGKAKIYLPIFVVTVITALLRGNVALAFLSELAGWLIAGFLASRKKKK